MVANARMKRLRWKLGGDSARSHKHAVFLHPGEASMQASSPGFVWTVVSEALLEG